MSGFQEKPLFSGSYRHSANSINYRDKIGLQSCLCARAGAIKAEKATKSMKTLFSETAIAKSSRGETFTPIFCQSKMPISKKALLK
jgi:hypothetical protein